MEPFILGSEAGKPLEVALEAGKALKVALEAGKPLEVAVQNRDAVEIALTAGKAIEVAVRNIDPSLIEILSASGPTIAALMMVGAVVVQNRFNRRHTRQQMELTTKMDERQHAFAKNAARQQGRIAMAKQDLDEQNFRLALFDRRFSVYEAFREAQRIAFTSPSRESLIQAQNDLSKIYADILFLFETNEIQKYYDEYSEKLIGFSRVHLHLEQGKGRTKTEELQKQYQTFGSYFEGQYEVIFDLFQKHISPVRQS